VCGVSRMSLSKPARRWRRQSSGRPEPGSYNGCGKAAENTGRRRNKSILIIPTRALATLEMAAVLMFAWSATGSSALMRRLTTEAHELGPGPRIAEEGKEGVQAGARGASGWVQLVRQCEGDGGMQDCVQQGGMESVLPLGEGTLQGRWKGLRAAALVQTILTIHNKNGVSP
jgi:hypothetical protein